MTARSAFKDHNSPGILGQPAYASSRERRAWYCYDFGNSAFFSSVVTLFMGPHLTALAQAAAGPDGRVYPLGIPVSPGAYYPYLVSLSVFLQIFTLPLMGAVADYARAKRLMLAITALLGAACTGAVFFAGGTRYLLGGSLFVVANLAFGASIVFYNAFLPDLAPPEKQDAVSSRGWAIGYLGGGLALALHLAFVMNAGSLGFTTGDAVRIAIASTGLWALVFTLPTVAILRDRGVAQTLPAGQTYFGAAARQFFHTLKGLPAYPQTMLFLLAYLIYNDAIQTVISLSSVFGREELKLPITTLTQAILLVQFVAFGGALLFNWLAGRIGTKPAVMVSLGIWTATIIAIYAFVQTTTHFFVMAGAVALVLGGSQALSRSLFSRMIPAGKEAEYFSLYEISDKGTSWLGPLVFGLVQQQTGSFRLAILSLIVFFAAGLSLLFFVNVARAEREARP